MAERKPLNYEKNNIESERLLTTETGAKDDPVLQKAISVQSETSYNGVKNPSYQADTSTPFDIDRLARAIAFAETQDCTKGVGKSQLNCFGIRNGNTAPCQEIRNRFCVYQNKEESYEAFKIIWEKWYKGLPDINKAKKWTATQPHEWLSNVLHHYNTNG